MANTRIQPSTSPSEHRANAFAEALTGQRPSAVHDPHATRFERARPPAPVEVLIDVAQRESSQPIPNDLQRRLGPDVSQVRLHSGEAAGIASRAVGAQAFTVGHDVFFAPGKLRPDLASGRALLAHELSHALAPVNLDQISRTPGVAYPNEQTAAREAFRYLLEKHPDQLEQEWGGYIYKQPSADGAELFFHSEPRTDGASGSVFATTEEYARAEVEDKQAEWDRRHARGEKNPDPRPTTFSPTRGWIEPKYLEERGAVITAAYHNHPKAGRAGNKASGFSLITEEPNHWNPFQLKLTGDIPGAHREKLVEYMIDLDKPTGAKDLGYDLQVYDPKTKAPPVGLHEIVGLPWTDSNEHKCQWGFAPDGTPDVDGTACAGVPPHQDVIEHATKVIESRTFALAVRRGDISMSTCLRWIAAAEVPEETMRCGIDPRSIEQRKLDELRQLESVVDALSVDGVTAHSLLGSDEDPMRPPR